MSWRKPSSRNFGSLLLFVGLVGPFTGPVSVDTAGVAAPATDPDIRPWSGCGMGVLKVCQTIRQGLSSLAPLRPRREKNKPEKVFDSLLISYRFDTGWYTESSMNCQRTPS